MFRSRPSFRWTAARGGWVALSLACLMALLATPQSVWPQGQRNSGPLQFDFSGFPGDPTYGVTGDGMGPYVHGQSFVVAELFVDGTAWFRTTNRGGQIRSLTLNFSNPIPGGEPANPVVYDAFFNLPLNTLGSNTIPDARIPDAKPFQDGALDRGVIVSIPFSMQPDFRGTGFRIEFRDRLNVSRITSDPADPAYNTVRVLRTGPGTVASLYQNTRENNKDTWRLVGRYLMPLEITITRLF